MRWKCVCRRWFYDCPKCCRGHEKITMFRVKQTRKIWPPFEWKMSESKYWPLYSSIGKHRGEVARGLKELFVLQNFQRTILHQICSLRYGIYVSCFKMFQLQTIGTCRSYFETIRQVFGLPQNFVSTFNYMLCKILRNFSVSMTDCII